MPTFIDLPEKIAAGLTESTKEVFADVSQLDCIKDLVLCGGTGQSIQMNHRLSEDLDFELIGLRKERPQLDFVAMIDITNTGSRAGDEIVQLYIRDDISSVSRPVKELRGFERVHLEPGETKTVTLPIDRTSLEFYNANLDLVVESGSFTIMVGPSSSETQSVSLQVTK